MLVLQQRDMRVRMALDAQHPPIILSLPYQVFVVVCVRGVSARFAVSHGASAYFTALLLLFVCESMRERSLSESFTMLVVKDCVCLYWG